MKQKSFRFEQLEEKALQTFLVWSGCYEMAEDLTFDHRLIKVEPKVVQV
ncbi:hypothetical protein BXA52_06005 [Enterococcus faecium]|uniref:Uncharacterized protein n=1 Tax=Enterococcus faecium (strain ATCC BAA-472 / TX0016 / DO) TaxID=333849 RepID=I3U698_ENTFD|nr:hypothetical protein HMPREF0351_12912 [Enterococcus faecium DO]EFR67903.1 hypothetical protein HMPREF9524_01946 [Enterococcus faecium TX0133a01]KAF3379151.1 hypothetical protein BXA52_06005 [Enterococcus faecium]